MWIDYCVSNVDECVQGYENEGYDVEIGCYDGDIDEGDGLYEEYFYVWLLEDGFCYQCEGDQVVDLYGCQCNYGYQVIFQCMVKLQGVVFDVVGVGKFDEVCVQGFKYFCVDEVYDECDLEE